MKVGFIITARLKSTRLPGKLLLPIQGEPVIGLMIDRLKLSPHLDEIIIATSENPEDDRLCSIAEQRGVRCFRGHERNVVERLALAGREYGLDYILNVTGDCPLVACDFIPDVLSLFEKTGADLVQTFDLPHGMFFYGIKPSALDRIRARLPRDAETSAWGIYFTESAEFRVEKVAIPSDLRRKDLRLTLDYPQDFEMLTAVYGGLGKDARRRSSRAIIAYLDGHPEIPAINASCEELYRKRFEEEYQYSPDRLET
ncbi:MAG: NTP transferase domain-containing protein [Methanomicrobiales archaeon]|nr:NTP transferase domain-containing protein [Methanomicrobiales archaeon]